MKIEHSKTETKGEFILLNETKKLGEMTYSRAGDTKIIIDHTFVEPSEKGKGLGLLLVEEGVKYARENQLKIIPLCPFANKVLRDSSDYQDVLN